MSLRRPYAAVLQLLRTSKGLHQYAIASEVAQSFVSNLEASKTTATVDSTKALADALQVNAATFFGLVIAASQHQTPREVMLSAIAEMEALGLADTVLPAEPQKLEAPVVAEARERKDQVQRLKAQGYSRAQTARELGCSWTTVDRLWVANDPANDT
ncbi:MULTISPECIES: helix-turn-helix domain-containing protein [Pseudomonas]|jgi:transcriptional regulator with XRE-family HTH domain|uniref:helix-turn-helix domain-containing protein n=2 Tax=Bacteria TaxID=2 RepID=UPI000F59AD55|nr:MULTISPECIES: helix-turn-helix domain-containing protein [Pseudomonas]MBC8785942.1 transcriptional regulator [Pseudomonas fluorescens]MCQ9185903.1 transcriptional regulator [Streptomyces hayashii]NMZ91510.1 transcriptional regulator [Pseudomonas marginalis]RQO49133.1 transcriptional regulator [Pseudomonas sp. KBW05]